jgi:hypothetical protein
MADEKSNTPGGRRKRPAPTIDLSATEVKSAEPPPSQAAGEQVDEKVDPPQSAAPPQGRTQPILLAAIAGGLGGAAVVAAGLWLGGVLPLHRSSGNLDSRIAALEAQVKAAAKPDDEQPLADLSARIGKLEQTESKPAAVASDPALAERLTAVESAMKALGVTLTALSRRAEDSAASVTAARERADAAAKTAEALQTKLDAVAQSTKATQDKIAQNTGSDMAARRALAALALRDAAARGAPYAAELATVKQLGGDPQSVAALEPLAASGIPTEAALSRELAALLPAMVKASGTDASKTRGGFFERLQANAGKLVRIRPIGEPAGDDAPAVLARIEVKASHNDLAGVAAELDKLPAEMRAPADAWRKKLAARNAALAASRRLAADSAATLGSP